MLTTVHKWRPDEVYGWPASTSPISTAWDSDNRLADGQRKQRPSARTYVDWLLGSPIVSKLF
jgi:hypothetical protein